MSKPFAVPSLFRLIEMLRAWHIPYPSWEEEDLQDLASAESALLAFRNTLDQSDPKVAQTDAALTGLKHVESLDFDAHHIDHDHHEAAYDWILEQKAEAIKALMPAAALLDELAARNRSDTAGE